jgi:hypothetical protein
MEGAGWRFDTVVLAESRRTLLALMAYADS